MICTCTQSNGEDVELWKQRGDPADIDTNDIGPCIANRFNVFPTANANKNNKKDVDEIATKLYDAFPDIPSLTGLSGSPFQYSEFFDKLNGIFTPGGEISLLLIAIAAINTTFKLTDQNLIDILDKYSTIRTLNYVVSAKSEQELKTALKLVDFTYNKLTSKQIDKIVDVMIKNPDLQESIVWQNIFKHSISYGINMTTLKQFFKAYFSTFIKDQTKCRVTTNKTIPEDIKTTIYIYEGNTCPGKNISFNPYMLKLEGLNAYLINVDAAEKRIKDIIERSFQILKITPNEDIKKLALKKYETLLNSFNKNNAQYDLILTA